MLDLTIAIPVKNEAHQIAECINHIGKDFAKYIDVIDSNSNDDTAEIAKELGANVIQFNWDGKYPKKRNWYLFNYTPKSKWVLFLDADELLTENFKRRFLTLNLNSAATWSLDRSMAAGIFVSLQFAPVCEIFRLPESTPAARFPSCTL